LFRAFERQLGDGPELENTSAQLLEMSFPMHAIYSRFMGVAFALTGCVASAPAAEGEVAALASAPKLPAAGAPAPAITLPSSAGPTCRTDADCQLVPDYCAECACVSLNAQQKMPECLGEELKCVLNPCADQVALCINGQCAAESDSFR
jgi:hypothetical protein